jgi:hypothetical protein
MCLSVIEAADAATVLDIVRRSALPHAVRVLPAVRFDQLDDRRSAAPRPRWDAHEHGGGTRDA